LIFGAPEALTKGGDPSTCQSPPESKEKTMVLGGGLRARQSHAWNPGPPRALKSKKITKTRKLLVTSRSVTRTPLHACAQARWRTRLPYIYIWSLPETRDKGNYINVSSHVIKNIIFMLAHRSAHTQRNISFFRIYIYMWRIGRRMPVFDMK